jgi:predicted TIM-barrel fold metal-dependent hydrolase
MIAVFKRHPKTTFIWAHVGLGRIIRPIGDHGASVRRILEDPALANVRLRHLWNETAKYLTANDEALKLASEILNRYPDRFIFGTDEVAPKDQDKYLAVYHQYEPLWKRLDRQTSEKVRPCATTSGSSTRAAAACAPGKRPTRPRRYR